MRKVYKGRIDFRWKYWELNQVNQAKRTAKGSMGTEKIRDYIALEFVPFRHVNITKKIFNFIS